MARADGACTIRQSAGDLSLDQFACGTQGIAVCAGLSLRGGDVHARMAPFALGQRFVAEMLSRSFNAMAKSINRDGALDQLGRTAMKQLMDWVDPKPGQGPSEKHLESSGYLLRMKATSASGAIVRGHARAHGHPGYRSTAMLIAEAGLLLAGAGAPGCSALPRRFGFLTPATAFAVGSVPAWARTQMLFEFTD